METPKRISVLNVEGNMKKKLMLSLLYLAFGIGGFSLSCTPYRLGVGHLIPMAESEQNPQTHVSDDGTVTFTHERLEISLRPMTDEELNRQFPIESQGGAKSVNPYTCGDWKDQRTGESPERFTVFKLKVKNYAYPKIQVDPLKSIIVASNGREYSPLGLNKLEKYYLPYARGYSGNAYERYKKRIDILNATLYSGDVIFSGQEGEGYVVFPKLDPDVKQITVWLRQIILRFDVTDQPLETIDIKFLFHRNLLKTKQSFF